MILTHHGINSLQRGNGLGLLYLNYFEDSNMVPEVKDPAYTDTINIGSTECDWVPGYFPDKNAIHIYSGSSKNYYISQSLPISKKNVEIEFIVKGTSDYDLSVTGMGFGSARFQLVGREVSTRNCFRFLITNLDNSKPKNKYGTDTKWSALNDSSRCVVLKQVQPTSGWHILKATLDVETKKYSMYLDDELVCDAFVNVDFTTYKFPVWINSETFTYSCIMSEAKIREF